MENNLKLCCNTNNYNHAIERTLIEISIYFIQSVLQNRFCLLNLSKNVSFYSSLEDLS